jgi:hypothetical protein
MFWYGISLWMTAIIGGGLHPIVGSQLTSDDGTENLTSDDGTENLTAI